MPGREWCYVRDGRRHGPVPTAELLLRAAAGDVGRDDLVWPTDDPGKAAPGRSVKGLFPRSGDTGPDLPAAPPAPAAAGKPLVACGRCGSWVSDTAETCPHCGERQPKLDEKECGHRGGSCARCGVFNIGSTRYGDFRDRHACRGCGCPLTDALPYLHTETEAERVYENAMETGKTFGWIATVVGFVVYWLNGGELVPRLLVSGVVYLVVSYAVASVVWARGALVGFGKRSVRAAELYAGGWDSAKDRYRNRYAPFRPVTPGVTPAPAGSSFPWGTVLLCVLLFSGYQGCHAYFNDYAAGRRAGVAHVREMAAKGAFIRSGMVIGNALDLIPSDPKASPDWNAGFRAGFKEELARMYPQLPQK